jgi:hypothetical protein
LHFYLSILVNYVSVKKEHAKVLLSEETEHVKVIDAMTYIPSPDKHLHERTRHACSPRTGSNTYLVSDEVFESPISGRGRVDHGKHGNRGQMQRRRVTRRRVEFLAHLTK